MKPRLTYPASSKGWRRERKSLSRAGVPVAKLVPVEVKKNVRPLGFARGEIWVADDFDAPLPDYLLAAFDGELEGASAGRRKRKRK